MQERAAIIGRTIVADLNDPFNVAVLDGGILKDDPARLRDEASAISMMGGDRLIRVEEAGDALTTLLAPLLGVLSIDPLLVLPTLTKLVAGGTAMLGVVGDMLKQGSMSVPLLNASAGFLIHPLDLTGLAVLMSAGRRSAAVWRPAALGGCVGIAIRTAGHILLG